jgi:signal transduction histidine kinase/transcriptional regulator with PAS, ATPase and Fis domain
MPTSVDPSLAELLVPASLLDTSETGIMHLRPVYAQGDSARLVDFAFLRLNPTAQRLLELPEFPTGSFLALRPGDKAAFLFYRDTYLTGATGRHPLSTPPGWRALAQRQDAHLVVSLTVSPAASALPGQAAAHRAANDGALTRAQQATQQLTQERDTLRRVLAQTPAAICLLRGPEYRFEYVNPAFAQLFANRALEGLPAAEVLPEALNQGFISLLDRVYETGETLLQLELPLGGRPTAPRFFDFTYQAHLENGLADRLSVFAYDATEQVTARQQVHRLNEELRAANAELLANNAELTRAQQQLQQLNEELEVRVAAGIAAAQQAQAEAEQQRQRLARFIEQAPVAICALDGPALVYELVNPVYQRYFLGRQLLGQPVETVPELLAQHIPAVLRQVYDTGITHEGQEVRLLLARTEAEPPQEIYFNCVYQARYDEHDQVDGVLVFAYDVTEQVRVRQQVHRLNQELEARVQERTQQLQAARTTADTQRQQLHTIIQHAPVAISYVEGPELRVAAINPAACLVWRSSQEALLGQPLLEALPQLRGKGFEELLREAIRTHEPYVGHEIEIPVQGPSQVDTGYFNFVYQPIAATASTEAGVLTVAVEVTEQVLARQQVHRLNQELEARVQERTQQLHAALLEAEQQRGHLSQQQSLLRQILGQLPAAVATLAGPEHRFVFFNDGYQVLTNQRAQLGYTVAELFPELVAQGFTAILDEVYATGQPYWGERQPARLQALVNGQPEVLPKYVDFLYQPLKSVEGHTQGILAFIIDVTEQVLAQQRTEALQAEVLAASQRREQEREASYQVFAHTPAIVALLRGPAYQLEYFNAAFEQLFPGQTLHGKPLTEFLPEAVRQNLRRQLDRVYQTGESSSSTEVPLTMAKVAGQPARVIYLNITYQAYQQAGQTVGVSVFAFDVSEQVRARVAGRQQLAQANEELRTSNQQLLRTNVDLDNFIYTASHDLKAPIANIDSLLRLLRQQLPIEAREAGLVPRVLDMMQGAVERFQLTIAQLTDLSQLQQAHANTAETLDLAAVVEAVRLDLLPQIEAADGLLTIDLVGGVTLPLAPQQLRSVLYNLLSNAFKYSHPDRRPEVLLHCHHRPGATVLEVHDNGLGLAPEQHGKVFELFRRLHAHVGGSGVGLYMVKRIVENAGGTITVQSQLGAGSIFIASFPEIGRTIAA